MSQYDNDDAKCLRVFVSYICLSASLGQPQVFAALAPLSSFHFPGGKIILDFQKKQTMNLMSKYESSA